MRISDWSSDVCSSDLFIKRCERIILRSGAVAESCDLRKNEPHPVALFLPTADLGECCVIGLGLRFDKAVEVVGLIHGLHGYQLNVSCSISSRDRLDFCSDRSVSVDVSRRCRLLPGGWWSSDGCRVGKGGV